VAFIDESMRESPLRLFGHILMRTINAVGRNSLLIEVK
jgi:hypothetical protein